jgi:hypothetical protein
MPGTPNVDKPGGPYRLDPFQRVVNYQYGWPQYIAPGWFLYFLSVTYDSATEGAAASAEAYVKANLTLMPSSIAAWATLILAWPGPPTPFPVPPLPGPGPAVPTADLTFADIYGEPNTDLFPYLTPQVNIPTNTFTSLVSSTTEQTGFSTSGAMLNTGIHGVGFIARTFIGCATYLSSPDQVITGAGAGGLGLFDPADFGAGGESFSVDQWNNQYTNGFAHRWGWAGGEPTFTGELATVIATPPGVEMNATWYIREGY